MRHATKPLWGVQFHPESIATEHGRTVLRNFRDITLRRMQGGNSGCCPTVSPPSLQALSPSSPPSSSPSTSTKTATTPREVHVEAWSGSTPTTTAAAPRSAVSAHSIFTRLFSARRFAFWLDSSSAQSGNSRFSYMGCADGPLAGPLSKVVEYCASTRRVQVRHRGGAAENGARISEEDDDEYEGTVFEYLQADLASHSLLTSSSSGGSGRSGGGSGGGSGGSSSASTMAATAASMKTPPPPELGFRCGYVGFFGYEVGFFCNGTL